ncbi:hypothetical protein TNCV_3969921 [Trichonephila clavipes]|nr:hypothetical protein TNCV_3969921 [Trichonephila clavipes]
MGKSVLHELNASKKNGRFETSSALLTNQTDPFFNHIKMWEGKWILPKVAGRRQSYPTLPETKTPSKEGYGDFLMVLNWFDPPKLSKTGETIKAENYCDQITEMHQTLSLKKLTLVDKKGSIHLQENAGSRISMITRNFLYITRPSIVFT